MRVILTKDVDNVGSFGDVVNVADGFARNYLFRLGLALIDTKANSRRFDDIKKRESKLDVKRKEDAEAILSAVNGKTIEISHKGKDGKLYGSVTQKEMLEAVKGLTGNIEKKHLGFPKAIKEAGEYVIEVKPHRDVTGEIKLVISEDSED